MVIDTQTHTHTVPIGATDVFSCLGSSGTSENIFIKNIIANLPQQQKFALWGVCDLVCNKESVCDGTVSVSDSQKRYVSLCKLKGLPHVTSTSLFAELLSGLQQAGIAVVGKVGHKRNRIGEGVEVTIQLKGDILRQTLKQLHTLLT
eukprot:GHVR01032932.1.p1 GENE.GHVR01032932.1~~GHVR01032932.1.p1  ORF type:complete len:147 (+),score=51.85 GHVR01032932.1:135-575(+)